MRIPLWCMFCQADNGAPDAMRYMAELQDNGLYTLTCRHGHESSVCLQEQKFEVLFELALNAIVDGYYREAVASFTSSLERFFEFYLRVISIKRSVPKEAFDTAWKEVSKQSERQLGAYALTYLQENKVSAPMLSQNNASFRNSVIHAGVIPTKTQAIAYGKAVLSVIYPTLQRLKEQEPDSVSEVVRNHIGSVRSNADPNKKIVFMSAGMTLSIAVATTQPPPDIDLAIQRIGQGRQRTIAS